MISKSTAASQPVRLEPNTIPSFYQGDGRIGAWRRKDVAPTHPEDWVASTSTRTGMGDLGLTVFPNGDRLIDSVRSDPAGWFGPSGHGVGMLLKLLDAGERLPVHVHPDAGFARAQLGQANGKAEAWLVLDAEPGSAVHIGFRHDVSFDQLERWVERQDVGELLTAMNRVGVQAGDVIFCPPRVPHAIGDGILVIEVQEPSDSSIMLEWDGFPIAEPDRFLGLEPEEALQAVDRGGYASRLSSLIGRSFLAPATSGVHSLLPSAAQQYFSADLLVPGAPGLDLPAQFAVLFVVDGAGELSQDGISTPIGTGETILLSYAVGTPRLTGDIRVIRCTTTQSTPAGSRRAPASPETHPADFER